MVCFVWRAASSGGLRDDTALQLGWWSVASLTFTRKCVLRASDCGCGNGFKFPLAEDRGLSRSRFNRHSPFFNQHSPGFVCSVLRIADAGMAVSDRGLSRSRFNRPSPGFNRHSPGFVCSLLRFADAGMAFSLAKDRDLSRCGMKCPSH